MKNYSQKYTAWILISIFGLASVALSGRRVLCIGNDGHSKIEQSVDACCDQDDLSHPECATACYLHETDSHDDDECGDCSDIDVSTLLSPRTNGKNFKSIVPSSPTAICAFSVLSAKADTSEKNRNLSSLHPLLSQLIITKTVVLC